MFRERVLFYSARQEKNESILSWLHRIRSLSADCKFGAKIDAILLDRFISGITTATILDRLCDENEGLTMQRAVEIATSDFSC